MPVNDDDLGGFDSPNVVSLSRAAGSFGSNPESAGKAVQMSSGLGLPPSVIGADLETFQQVDKGQKAAAAIERNGWISDYVARNPMAAEVSSDDYDNLEKVSKAVQPFTVAGRQGGLLQAAPEFFLHTIPEMASLLTSEEGRAKLVRGLGRFGEHLADQLAQPGQVMQQGFDLHDPADIDKALGLGLLIGLGKGAPKVENFPRLGRSTPGEIDAFLHQAQGMKTRAEIDEFLAGKAAPDKDPKQILQIEYAKADAAKLDEAVVAAEATKTKARAPSLLEDFIAGHETENLQLPATVIADLYRAEGKVPGEGDGLFGFVPDLARDLSLGVDTGVELTVPASKYIAHIDPAVHEKVKDLIRFRPEGLTVAEAKETKPDAVGEQLPESILGAFPDMHPTNEGAISIGNSGFTIDEQTALRNAGLVKKFNNVEGIEYEGVDVEKLWQLRKQAQENRRKPKTTEPATPMTPDHEELGLRPLFSEPPPEMTKPEFERYNRRIQDAQQAILDKATAQVEKQKDARQTAEWKAREAEVRAEMQTAVAARSDVATESFLKKGKLKLDSETVDGMLPDNSIPAALKTTGAAHPDDIAPFVGFNSGAELVKGLNDLITDRKARNESPTRQLDRLVSEATSAAMEARHGDFGRQIAEEARALALDDIHFDLLSDELRQLARQAGGTPPMGKAELKEWVGNQFASLDTKVAANYTSFQKAAGRAGREAKKALLAGDAVEAFKAKQRQVLSWLLAKESNKFAKEIEKTAAKIDRVQGPKEIASMDQAHFDQLRSMLASVGFTPKHPIPQGLTPLADFVASSDGQLAVATWLTDGSTRPADPAKLTAEEMRDLGKSINSMMHVGRAVKTLVSARGKAEIQNVVFDIKAELDRFNLIEQPLNPSVGQRAKSLVRWVNAWSLLVERMLDYTDKFDPNGPLTTYLDRPLRDSNVKEIQLNERTTRQLQKLGKLTDNSINDIIPNSVIPSELNESGFLDMNRRNLRQLMGYMGSASGIKKVTQGFGVDEAAVWKLINDNATKADWQWVAGMHEIFEGLWKESAAMQERYTGVVADPVRAQVMKSDNFGDFPGGYWPIKYDRMRSNIEGHIAAKSDLFDKHYVTAITPQAYTMPRTQYAAPLDLSGQLIGSHIRGMIHDISFRESVNNAAKLINNAEFMAAMTQKWSKEYAGLLPGWIKDIANSQRVDDSYAMGAARWSSLIRQNITSTLIALNPGTVIKHGMSAFGMSTERVGFGNLVSATWDVGARGIVQEAKALIKGERGEPPLQERLDAIKAITDPSEIGDKVRQFIIDSSAVMRNRQRASMDNVRESYEQNIKAGMTQGYVDARHIWMDIGRVPVALSDAVSAMPTWLAAYRKALTEGEAHVDAVFVADKEVSRAHGSSFIGDKPRILRTDETVRWITGLYNFWNHNFNAAMQWMWDAGAWAKGREEPGANIAGLGRRLFWLGIWSVAAEEIASPALDEDRRSLGSKVFMATLRHVGGWFVGLRDITNAAAHGYEPSVGLIGTLFKEIGGVGAEMKRVGASKELSKNWLIHAFTALGFATGLGGSQLGRTTSYIKDRATGTERTPRSWAELRQGLRTGHSKARIHK